MKRIDEGHWQHNGYDIHSLPHPKLYGKYEIYNGENFINRACTLSEAKGIIRQVRKFVEAKRGTVGTVGTVGQLGQWDSGTPYS